MVETAIKEVVKPVKFNVNVNGSNVQVILDNPESLKKAISNDRYVNRKAFKLNLKTVDSSFKKPVDCYLKFQNDNMDSKNPRNGDTDNSNLV